MLCETAWLAGEPCQAAVVPRIVEVAASREAAREEAREQQELTTLVYLMVSTVQYSTVRYSTAHHPGLPDGQQRADGGDDDCDVLTAGAGALLHRPGGHPGGHNHHTH